MKTYRLEDIDLLITQLYTHPHRIIVIDGEDRVGKSTRIAPRIANVLAASVIHLDDYLITPSDSYDLNMDELSRDITKQQKSKSIIIEGVMAMKTLKTLQIEPEVHIYVEGPSCRATWTNPNGMYQGKTLDEILMQEEQELQHASPQLRLTVFRKEVIKYHFDFRPFENADYKLIVE